MMGTHRKVLGIIHVGLGLSALLPTIIVTAVFGGVMGVVAAATHGDPEAAHANAIVGLSLGAILLVVMIATATLGLLSIVAGAGVLLGHRWGDYAVLALAVLHLFNLPVGTALAAYAFWTLLKAEPFPQRALPRRDFAMV